MGMKERPVEPDPTPPPSAPEKTQKPEYDKDGNLIPAKPKLDQKKVREIVDKTPGAQVWQEGMKLPGQEEREEAEAEWSRGEFDPVGDLVVTGIRLERGEGRDADNATGPQCGEWDDCWLTLRGTPVAGSYDPFYTHRGAEAALVNRLESKWLVELSDPKLTDYWRKSLRGMSRGDLCRFTIAAKKSQVVLQSLADCCLPPGGGDGSDGAGRAETRVEVPAARVQVGTSGRDLVVELRLDSFSPCANVAKRKQPPLYKRVLQYSGEQLARISRDPKLQLKEELKHIGEGDAESKEDDEKPIGREGRRREPRAPDRVRLRYTAAKRVENGGALQLAVGSSDPTSGGGGGGRGGGGRFKTSTEFVLGGGFGGLKTWPALDELSRNLEEGERASFTFTASAARLPLHEAPFLGAVAEGDQLEVDATLERLLKQKDVSRAKDNSVHKCKLATGKGYWKPRPLYKATITACVAPRTASAADGRKPPSAASTYQLVLGPFLPAVGQALQDVLYMMSVDEVALVTARPADLTPWPAGGPLSGGLPSPSDDGTLTMWVRLDAMTRVEEFGSADLLKETLNDEDLEWLEKAFVETKGELPMLEEDVRVEMSVAAADGEGKPLFAADRRLAFRTGDAPLAEDNQLMLLMTMYQGERAKVTAKAEEASKLLTALCAMRAAQGGCGVDAKAAAKHVAQVGLTLHVTILSQLPPASRDHLHGLELLAACEDIKARANALLTSGKTAGAMRKYVFATWLMQDGKEAYNPGLPMTEVIGVGKGDEPRVCRFPPELAPKVKALRVSLHLNLANGALKLGGTKGGAENYGALAAARVARELAPESVKPLYREAQALVALQEFDEAKATLMALLKLEANNKDARALLATVKEQKQQVSSAIKQSFSGMFSRAHREGVPLYTKADIERTTAEEVKRTQYVRDRAEERRRGVEAYDVKAMGRLPEDLRQKEIDKMNEAMENDDAQHKIPEGLTAEQFQRVLQMRTDGEKEERVQDELQRMKREEMSEARKHMTRQEVERMGERQAAIQRDRYKSEEVLKEREQELWDEYEEIKKRIEKRIPLMEAEQRRQKEMMEETSKVLDDETADEDDKARAIRRMVHEPFQDLDAFLTDGEMHELNELKAMPDEARNPQITEKLQALLAKATERRIEAKIDELIDREDDVLV